MISLSSVVPFIAIIVQPDKIFTYPFMNNLADLFNLDSTESMAKFVALLFVSAAILSAFSFEFHFNIIPPMIFKKPFDQSILL